jgi:hypothetical protein
MCPPDGRGTSVAMPDAAGGQPSHHVVAPALGMLAS